MLNKRKVIGVMGSGKEEHRELVVPLARWIAEHGFDLLTGAGSGVMRAAAEAFVAVEGRKGISIGVIPGEVVEGHYRPRPGYPNAGIELPIYTHLPLSGELGRDVMSRNHLNVLSSHALVVLPGGQGTAAEAILGLLYDKPLILYGPSESFRKFPSTLERTPSLERVCDFLLTTVR